MGDPRRLHGYVAFITDLQSHLDCFTVGNSRASSYYSPSNVPNHVADTIVTKVN